MSNEKAREHMAEESEHKSAYCAKHLILPSFDEKMCIQCRSDLRTLKSLGLYWRTWPSEKPHLGDYVLIISKRPGIHEWVHAAYVGTDQFLTWENVALFKLHDGDQWLPLKALEVLP